ncbi:MAG: tetratricopeptide repeat protein [Desulfomonilia bacterium]
MWACVLVVCLSANVLAEDWGYVKSDQIQENRKYIEKLTQDREKIEHAIRNTKRLIDLSSNKPYLPELFLRLAELYVEESRIVYYLRKNQQGESSSPFDQLETNTLKNQALEVYQRILDTFPDYPDRDKVIFFMAHECRELGMVDDMVRHYRTVIKEYPKSLYVPESYLLLGDYFIGHQDLDLAQRHYTAVLNHPQSPAVTIARYKLAWCHINRAEFPQAIKLFEEAVTSAESAKELEIDTYKRVDIRLEALMDMAYCYPECYKDREPKEALAYFQQYSWSRQVYSAVLEKLAYRFFIKKRWHHASLVYRELCSLVHNPEKLLEYTKNIFECSKALDSFEYADIDMELIVKALRAQKYSTHIEDEQKKKDQKNYELYARNIVTHLHDEARKKKSIEDFSKVADSYRLYLEFFTDSPVLMDMKSNYAEALFSSNQYLHAGRQYEELSKRQAIPLRMREEKLYGAVISYYHALKEKDALNHYEIACARAGLKTTGEQYASEFPDSSRVPDVLFNVAWISYDTGHYDQAIEEFTRFVARYPTGSTAQAAIHLILDSFNVREDYEGLIRYGKDVLNNPKITDTKLRQDVAGIVQATESKVLSSLTLAALDDWDTKKGDLIKFASQGSSSEMSEQALCTLIASSKEKHDLRTMISTVDTLVKEYPRSEKMGDILSMIIDATLLSRQYRLVANYLEMFVSRNPKNSHSQDFLIEAGRIRQDLGQYEYSNTAYRKVLVMKTDDRNIRETSILAMAENAIALSDTDTALDVLVKNRKDLSGDTAIRADAIISYLFFEKGDRKKAVSYRQAAEKAYRARKGAESPRLNDDMARMTFHGTRRLSDVYFSLVLKDSIDTSVVAEKTKLFERLEAGFQSVITYRSHLWALKSCFESCRVNHEFARFLKESPVPDLSEAEKQQYLSILEDKATVYETRAEQYLHTMKEQAEKLQICDPDLIALLRFSPGSSQAAASVFEPFTGTVSCCEMTTEALDDAALIVLHERLLENPDDEETVFGLMEAYCIRGDYRLSAMIAREALNRSHGRHDSRDARLYNCLGLSLMSLGDDTRAKEAFEEALECRTGHIAATMNLAALLRHYGHEPRSQQLYASLPEVSAIAQDRELVHPRAKEYYYESVSISKK